MIDAVVERKRRNRTWGSKRTAQQIALAFGVDIDKVEYLDQTLFWTAADLEEKLRVFSAISIGIAHTRAWR